MKHEIGPLWGVIQQEGKEEVQSGARSSTKRNCYTRQG